MLAFLGAICYNKYVKRLMKKLDGMLRIQPIMTMGFCFYIQPVNVMGFFYSPCNKGKEWELIIKTESKKQRE